MMTEEPPAIFFETPEEWRAWLAAHHATETEVWVGYWKKHTGRRGLTWSQAVDQALCFGWIDSVVHRVDDERHQQRFTRRRRGSSWSRINVAKVAALEEQGLMTDAGRAAFDARTDARTDARQARTDARQARTDARQARTDTRQGDHAREDEAVDLDDLGPEYTARLAASPAAQEFFDSRPPAYRRIATRWVMSAKQEPTRERRMAELVADCEAGRLIRPMRYGRNKPAP